MSKYLEALERKRKMIDELNQEINSLAREESKRVSAVVRKEAEKLGLGRYIHISEDSYACDGLWVGVRVGSFQRNFRVNFGASCSDSIKTQLLRTNNALILHAANARKKAAKMAKEVRSIEKEARMIEENFCER